MGHFQVVVDEAQLASGAGRRVRNQLGASFGREVDRIPGNAGYARRARLRAAGVEEVERPIGRETLREFLLDEVELVAVVRPAISTEQHPPALAVNVVAEADARLDCAFERLALL